MKNKKICIVIIEPSEFIIKGLLTILNESEQFMVSNSYKNIQDYRQNHFSFEKGDIYIINPSLLLSFPPSTVRTIFPDTYLVGIVYNYIDKETLHLLDDYFEINEPIRTILSHLQKREKIEKNTYTNEESEELTEREKEILITVAKGLTNKEIADTLNISIHTVMAHRKNITRKIHIKSVSGFVIYALLNNFLEEKDLLLKKSDTNN